MVSPLRWVHRGAMLHCTDMPRFFKLHRQTVQNHGAGEFYLEDFLDNLEGFHFRTTQIPDKITTFRSAPFHRSVLHLSLARQTFHKHVKPVFVLYIAYPEPNRVANGIHTER